MLTQRLEIRPAVEVDRARFLEMFSDEAFMVYSGGVPDVVAANARFDRMMERATEFPFAKQPVIERSSGTIFGYSGVDVADFEGERRVEFGYRLMPEARGRGYATEAGLALIELAHQTWNGELLAFIDPRNRPSSSVAKKLGFQYWKHAQVYDVFDDIYRMQIGEAFVAGTRG